MYSFALNNGFSLMTSMLKYTYMMRQHNLLNSTQHYLDVIRQLLFHYVLFWPGSTTTKPDNRKIETE